MSGNGALDFLAANGLFCCNGNNDIFCSICTIDARLDSWEKHIVDPTHVQTLEQFNQIFEPIATRSHCRLCGDDFDWRVLKNHAKSHMILPWHRPYDEYDKYKIFFDNHIIEWKSLFHCCICNVTFSKFDVAFLHIADPTHQSRKEEIASLVYEFPTDAVTYDFLVSECLIASTETALECRICGCTKVSVDSVSRHVKALMHQSNRSRFRLEFTERKAEEPVVEPTNDHLQSEETASEDSGSEESGSEESAANDSGLEESTPEKIEGEALTDDREIVPQSSACNYIVKHNNTDSYCIICNCVMVHHSINNHMMEKDHVDALKAYGCDEILFNNSSEYYCTICNRKMTGPASVYAHIVGNKHLKSLNKSREQRVRTMPNEVCTIKRPEEDTKRVSESEGSYHVESREKGNGENILLLEDNDYYCKCCNVSISGPKNMYLHLRGKRHLYSCRLAERLQVRPQPDSFEALRRPNTNLGTRENRLPCLPNTFGKQAIETGGLETLKRRDGSTLKTDERRLPSPGTLGKPQIQMEESRENLKIPNVDSQMKNENYSTWENTFSLQQSRIRRDKSESPTRPEVVFHAKDEDCADSPNESAKRNAQRAGSLVIPRRPKHIPEQIFESLKIPDVNSQKKEEYHSTWDTTFGLQQAGTSQDNFEPTMRPEVVCHTKDEHRVDLSNESDKRQAQRRPPVILRRPKHIPERLVKSSTCNYLVRLNDVHFRCEVCDCTISGLPENINIHVTGSYHVASLKKYGCDYVTPKGDDIYYCECCDAAMVHLENVHLHIKNDRHINIVAELNRQQLPADEMGSDKVEMSDRIPEESKCVPETACSTSPSIYILKKNATVSHCELCDVDLVGRSETSDHIAGADHAASVEKYGCDCVVLVGGDDYHCVSCKCNISGRENVYLHVKGRRHFFGRHHLSDRQQLQMAKRNLNKLKISEGPDSNTALSLVTTEMTKMMKKWRILEKKSRRN